MAERDSLPYVTFPPSTTHMSNKRQVSRMSVPGSVSREAPVALEGDDAGFIVLSCGAGHGQTHFVSMLGLVPSAKRSLLRISRGWPRRHLYPEVVRKSG